MAMLKLGLNESIEYTSSSFIYGNSIDDLSNRMKETILIDLDQQSVDQLWGSIDAKRRNMIRKAQKNDVLVRQLSDGDLSLFYDLLISMNQRTGMKSKPLEFYQDIYRVLSPKKACVMAAYFEGKIIATIMIIGNNTMWHYWQGATDTSYNLGAMDLLLWESIIHAKASGGEAFDLCVIDRVKLAHLAKYKLSFGGVPVHYLVKGKKRIIARILTKLIHARTHKVMNAN